MKIKSASEESVKKKLKNEEEKGKRRVKKQYERREINGVDDTMVNRSLVLVDLGFLFLVEFRVLVGGSFLVLLVLRNQIVHVRLGFREFHLVHTFAGVPMKESFSPEHGCELFGNSLEQLLDGGGVTDEGGGHFQTAGWYVADGRLHVVRDPFDEVRAVLVLNVQHLFVDFFHRHSATENGCYREVPSVPWIAGGHHVLRVEHLLGEFWYGQCSVLLAATRCERSETWHKEVKTREWYHVHGEFPQVGVQLAREP